LTDVEGIYGQHSDQAGKTAEDFWKLVSKKGFVKRGEVVAEHSEMLAWL